jgi:hypothetical protein
MNYISKEQMKRIVLTKEEFLKHAKDSDLFEKVTQELQSPEAQAHFDKMTNKYNRGLSILLPQIVGIETY